MMAAKLYSIDLSLSLQPLHSIDVLVAGLIIVAAIATTLVSSRFAAIASLGVVGYAMALLFILYGAPDLAITQLIIESLTVVLIALAFYHLPPFHHRSSRRSTIRDAIFAGAAGLMAGSLTLLANQQLFAEPVSQYFLDHSWIKAYGRNVVNVILVDFRALDTLGEITVLGITGLGALTLLTFHRSHRKSAAHLTRISLILRTAAGYLTPLMMLFSMYLLLRGHNAPGGGFVGGLTAAAGISLYALAFDTGKARRLLRIHSITFSGVGLLLAAASGLFGVMKGQPYLTGVWRTFNLPFFPSLKIGTPFLFDVGVYLLVIGVVVTILFSLAEEEDA